MNLDLEIPEYPLDKDVYLLFPAFSLLLLDQISVNSDFVGLSFGHIGVLYLVITVLLKGDMAPLDGKISNIETMEQRVDTFLENVSLRRYLFLGAASTVSLAIYIFSTYHLGLFLFGSQEVGVQILTALVVLFIGQIIWLVVYFSNSKSFLDPAVILLEKSKSPDEDNSPLNRARRLINEIKA